MTRRIEYLENDVVMRNVFEDKSMASCTCTNCGSDYLSTEEYIEEDGFHIDLICSKCNEVTRIGFHDIIAAYVKKGSTK